MGMKKMKNKLSDCIRYIGVDDCIIDLFESQYIVEKGISYNSYLILDEKVVLMDTVDKRKMVQWEHNLLKELNGKSVDYLVIQHLEPDHAGSLLKVMELFPDVILVGNAKTFTMMSQFFDINLEGKTLVVKEGDILSLGKHELKFIMAPMVHWPEVMLSYETSEKILFSADAFGKFGALELTKDDVWIDEARRYYMNIVGKYGNAVKVLLKKVSQLDIQCICPLHGPILSENLGYYIDLYNIWSSYQPEQEGILIVYASMHGNTAYAAYKIAELLRKKGVEKIVIRDLSRVDMSYVVEDAFRYNQMIVAGASYDGGVFPCMQDFLHHLQLKAYQNRKVGIVENGSWAPCAGKVMKSMLETMKNIDIVEPLVTIKSTLKDNDMKFIEQLIDNLLQ